MRLLPWKRKALTGSTAVVETLQSRQASFVIPLGGSNQQMIKAAWLRGQSASYGWLYAHRPAVRMVVDYIARNAAQLPLKLYERVDDDNRERNTEHLAAVTMRYPTGEYRGDATPAMQFIRGVMTDYLIYDRACVLKFRPDGGGPLILQRVPPTMVLPSGGLFVADFYRVFRGDGSYFDVQPEDMIHWHGYNPDDALIGLSRLETLRDSLTEDTVSQTATVELLKNGLKGGHIERPLDAPDWSPEALKRFQESWANQRAGSPRLDPLLEDGMKWVPTAMTPKDAELLAGRQWTVDEVAAVYNFPADLLRRAAGEAGELAEARKQFYADTLPPFTEDLEGQLDQDILIQEFGADDFYFQFDLNAKLRGDPVARYAAITSAVGAPWMLRAEARGLEDLPFVKGTDELITPLNVVEGDNPRPAPNVMPIQDPNGPPQDGTNPTAPTQQTPKPKALEPRRALLDGKASAPMVQFMPRRHADLTRQQKYVGEAEKLMERFYTRQARALRKKAAIFDTDRWDRELGDDLNVYLSSVVEREAGIYVVRLAGDAFDMRYVTNYLRATAQGIASAVNAVTESDIEDIGLDDALDRAKNQRAAVAATGLGARGAIFARMEAAKQAPHYELRLKTWVADTERHAEFDGDQVPIGEDWPAGFAPGSQPNCGCTAAIT